MNVELAGGRQAINCNAGKLSNSYKTVVHICYHLRQELSAAILPELVPRRRGDLGATQHLPIERQTDP